MFNPIKNKTNPESYWQLAERWFRLLEMSLILGTIGYLKDKIHNLALDVIYWISFAVLFWWFLELAEFNAKDYAGNKSLSRKWVIWCVSMGAFLFFYFAITSTTQWIIEQQIG